ncbi:MAG: DNA alkylation response protein [Rhizobiales bacterium]|nr:DNA alkylation response protein [Hyphomicrobiales bacterium]
MPAPSFDTHEVFNQSPPYADVDLFASDRPLQDTVAAFGGGDGAALSAFGQRWGAGVMLEEARLANSYTPVLRTFDAKGFRRDVVEFHPAYHALMAESIREGLHASTWQPNGTPAPAPSQVARAARFYMAAQVESGHLCPITMTRASVAALGGEPALIARLMPVIASRSYDASFRPWTEKSGMTLGMGMTEKQGGTDVRANTTTATPSEDYYRLTGHKWFMSAPMCDAFLVLAQAPGGLTCFFVPRFRPDGSVNALRFQRLKDKLGNRSNASSEVEFTEAYGLRIGDEGRGVRTILQMVQLTRLDCAISSAGLMRMALAQAVHHARHRSVFQRRLADQPAMRTVLADMALDVEVAVALVMRLCRAFDLATVDENEAAYARMLTPAIKYWVCKTAPGFIYEAMECLGGNGYVEDSILPRLYREAPVNAIWEGSGNVMCLDVLRAVSRDPEAADAVLGRLAVTPELREAINGIAATLMSTTAESHARSAVERLAFVAAAGALAQCAPADTADLFVRTRLGGRRGSMYGSSEIDNNNAAKFLARAVP